MHLGLRRFLSALAAPSRSPKSLQTTTTNINDPSDRSATTDIPLLPAPVTAKDVPSRPRSNSKSVQISGGLRVHWAAFKKKVTSGTAPSTSSAPDDTTGSGSNIYKPQGSAACEQDGNVDVVVVDRVWAEDPKWSTKSDSNVNTPPEETRASENKLNTTNTNTDPSSSGADTGFWASRPFLFFLRWKIWAPIWEFFWLRFPDQTFETHYAKETWFLRKRLALFSAAFFVLNWLLPIILITRPVSLADSIFYYGVGGPGSSISIIPKSNTRIGWPRDLNPPGHLGHLRLPPRPFSHLSDLPSVCGVVLAGVPSCLHVCPSQSIFSLLSHSRRHLCGFWDDSKPYVIYDCGTKDFLSTF